jgi:hypothetical protein
MTHNYKRHGTTTLFAALDVLDGRVIGRCMRRHRHQELIRFLNTIEAEIPAGKIIHVILDNYAPTSIPRSAPGSSAIPASSSITRRLLPPGTVEGFFAKLTKRRLKRGAFRLIVDLQATINRFSATNDNPRPFTWTSDPDKIIAAVKRGHQTLDSVHSQVGRADAGDRELANPQLVTSWAQSNLHRHDRVRLCIRRPVRPAVITTCDHQRPRTQTW